MLGPSTTKFNSNIKPLVDQTTMLAPDNSVVSGITAMRAFGHTPAHMVYMLESNGKSLLIAADFANHYVWSLAHPNWEVKFDKDKEAAANSPVQLLDMLTTDKIPFIGYHMPWPAVGYVEKIAEGCGYAPESYQLQL